MADKFDDIVKLINGAISDFNKTIPGVQQDVLDNILQQLRRLDVDSQNNIKTTVANLKIIGSIKAKMQSLILTDDYIKQVQGFVDSYTQIATLQNQYWKAAESTFTPKPLLREIRLQAVDDTVNSLTENGVGPNIADEISQILRTAITSGGSYKSLEDQLRSTLTDTNDSEGLLSKYARQITTDAINQYTRQYTQTVADDLGYQWYSYANSLIETSRPFCIAMHERDFFNVDEIPSLLKAKGLTYTNPKTGAKEKVPIYDKTGLPQGMYPTETPANFLTLLGGYNCGHQARPVSADLVKRYNPTNLQATELMKKAKQVGPEVDKFGKDVAEQFNGTVTPINFKNKGGILRKAVNDYSGDVSQVKDAVRNTVVIPGDQLPAAIAKMKTDPSVVKLKEQKSSTDPLGYSGVIMNIKTSAGITAEVQMNSPEMIYAKNDPESAIEIIGQVKWDEIHQATGLEGGLGHEYYEQWRILDPVKFADKRAELETISKAYYAHFTK